MHKSSEILVQELQEAEKQLPVGSRYSHYKDDSKIYEIIGFSIWEETDEVSVNYRAEYDKNLIFSRLAKVFLESVEVDGASVPRFARLD